MSAATRNGLLIFGLSWVPYVLIGWAVMHFGDGNASTFWYTIGALLIVRLFYSIIETLGGVLVWRAVGKRDMVSQMVQALSEGRFPPANDAAEGMLSYLVRIDDDDTPIQIRLMARELKGGLQVYESIGILPGMRVHAAMDAALRKHSETRGLTAAQPSWD